MRRRVGAVVLGAALLVGGGLFAANAAGIDRGSAGDDPGVVDVTVPPDCVPAAGDTEVSCTDTKVIPEFAEGN